MSGRPADNAPVKEWARYYHSLGLHPIPVTPGEKFPAVKWKEYQTRQPTAEEIEQWDWSGGVGITTNGFIVVDCDHGAEVLLKGKEFPISWTVRSGGGGMHRYFKSNGQRSRNRTRLIKGDNGSGIDFKAEGGFCILPPTRHKDTGKPYEWMLPPWHHALAPAPPWLLEAVKDDEVPPASVPLRQDTGDVTARARAYLATVPGAIQGQGGDTHTFVTACKTIRGFGLDEETAVQLFLEEWNPKCQPPWPAREIRQKVSNAVKYGTEQIGRLRDAEKPRKAGAAIVVQLSDIAPEPVQWTWPARIPRGKLTLLIGDPGLGKSLVGLDIESRITIGGLWPDGTQAPEGNVVLLTAEDGLADTVRPRLDALGGKPERVFVLRAMREGQTERGLDFTRDLPQFEDLITQSKAIAALIDPLSAYLGKTDSYRDSEVRAVLAPVAAIAERTGASILGIMHLTKNQQRHLIHRVQGNIAFAAAARAVFAVAEDRDTPDRRFFAPVKMNLARKPPSLAFRIEEAGGVPVPRWETAIVDVDVNTLFGPPESEEFRGVREQAVEFLREMLAEGQVDSDAVLKEAKRQRISRNTLFRAKGVLGVVSRKGGFMGGWTWELPVSAKGPKSP